jgi:hypothetical protein
MHATFFQKFTLTIIAGFFAACLVWFYVHIIEQGNDDINKHYQNNTGTTRSMSARR